MKQFGGFIKFKMDDFFVLCSNLDIVDYG